MSVIARWCTKHRLVTVVVWLALIIGLGALTGSAGTKYNDTMSIPASESSQAMDLLKQTMPASAGDSDQVVWHTSGGAKVTDADVQKRMTDALNQIATSPGVAAVTSPYSGPGGAGQTGRPAQPGKQIQISKDQTTAYATVNFAQEAHDLSKAEVQHVIDLAQGARGPNLQVELGGQAISQAERNVGGAADLIGVLAALVVLGLVFRAAGAAVMPILTGVAGVASGILGTGQLSHLISISSTAPTLATLVGLGVGIDYALFIVNRHRKGLMAGMSVEDSVAKALNTSGRAVIFAGGTVVIALLGMFALGLSFLNGMAIGAAVTVSMTVLAAITLLPAMLGFLKLRVLSKRQRRELAARQAGVGVLVPYTHASRRRAASASGPADLDEHGRVRESTVFTRWADKVQARPLGKAVLAIAVMAVVAVPFFSIRLGNSDAGNDPKSTTTRQAYDLLADGFGKGFNGPLLLVAQTPAAGDQQALTKLVDTIKTVPDVAAVSARPMQPGQAIGVVQVVPVSSPQDQATTGLIDALRHDVIPKAEAGTTLHVMVSGPTAISNDFSHTLTGKLPLFVAIIVGLGCLLMILAFRSLLVPLIGVAMNLLTMGVAFGSLVAVFQWGWGSEALGAGGAGPVEAFVPVIVISILFGLSMDYQVFLISRMHEEWSHSKDNSRSVRVGHGETGQVIVAAGIIMTCVFGAFLFNGQRVIAEFGLALAAAILLDVLMLRLILVPALMHRFGRANWWLPKWLDRVLPHVSVEGEPEAVPAAVSGPVRSVVPDARAGDEVAGSGPSDASELTSAIHRIQ